MYFHFNLPPIFDIHVPRTLAQGYSNKYLIYFFHSHRFRLVQPICLGGFVGYFAQTKINPTTLNDAYWYASGIVFSTVFMIATYHPFALYVYKTSYKIRVALSGLIYQKSLRILKSSAEEGQNGKIINLMSNDLTKIDIGLGFFHDFWKGPLEALTFFGIIYMEIGVSAVVGMAFLLSFIPLQGKEYIFLNILHFFLKTLSKLSFKYLFIF